MPETKEQAGNWATMQEELANKVDGPFKMAVRLAIMIPDLIALLFRLLFDQRVPWQYKLYFAGMVLAHLAPKKIYTHYKPQARNLRFYMLFHALGLMLATPKKKVLEENWAGSQQELDLARHLGWYLAPIIKGKNSKRLARFLRARG